MAQDQYNYDDNSQQQPYKPTDAEWNNASNILNKYVGDNGGGNIDWGKARSTFEQHAANGGNFGDWVNNTFNQKDSWVTPQDAPGYQAPPSPATSWNRTDFMNGSMSRPVGMTAQDFINANPNFSGGVRLLPGSNDKVILPTGEVMDLSINANAQGQGSANGWTTVGNWNGSSVVPYADGGGGAGAGAAGAGGVAGNTGITGGGSLSLSTTPNPAMQRLIDRLTGRANASETVDPNDPTIRGQVDAYRAEQERASRNHLADLAESSGPLANLQGEQRLAAERTGQSTGAFQADLQARELTAQRQKISDALSQLGSVLSDQQRMQLQMQLATMDDAIKRMQLQQQGSQFNADLGFRNAQLSQQGQLANNQLGFAYDQFDWDRSALNPKNMVQAS